MAELLGVSAGTARNYIDAGKFRRFRRLPSGDRRVWSEDVDAYIREIEKDQGGPGQPTRDPDD